MAKTKKQFRVVEKIKMNRSTQLTSNLFEFLNAKSNYAVLRNYEGLPLKNSSRDIDLLIEQEEFFRIEKEIVNIIVNQDFKIITRYRSEKMVTYICAYCLNGSAELVQFDFLFNTSIFGILLLNTRDILSSKLFNGSIYHVSNEYEFLDKYLWLKSIGKPYPEKYEGVRAGIKKNHLLSLILKELINCSDLEELENISSFKFKRKILTKNLRSRPLQQISMLVLFVVFYIKNIMCYSGFSIGFTGPDGSGKTTVVNLIIEGLGKVYSDIQLFHFRPSLTLNLGEVAHKTKLKSEVDRNYSQPHRGEKTSVINSLTRLLYYSFDFILGYFFRVRPYLHKRSVVIFDRYFTDIISDSKRSKIFLNHKFLYFFNKLFIPKLDYNILLTANKYVILSRKQELDEEGIELINKKLDFLSKKNGYYLVKNNTTPTDAVQKILTIVFEAQHKKNMKRIEQ